MDKQPQNNHHDIENLLAKINLGWKLYKSSQDRKILIEVQAAVETLKQLLKEK